MQLISSHFRFKNYRAVRRIYDNELTLNPKSNLLSDPACLNSYVQSLYETGRFYELKNIIKSKQTVFNDQSWNCIFDSLIRIGDHFLLAKFEKIFLKSLDYGFKSYSKSDTKDSSKEIKKVVGEKVLLVSPQISKSQIVPAKKTAKESNPLIDWIYSIPKLLAAEKIDPPTIKALTKYHALRVNNVICYRNGSSTVSIDGPVETSKETKETKESLEHHKNESIRLFNLLKEKRSLQISFENAQAQMSYTTKQMTVLILNNDRIALDLHRWNPIELPRPVLAHQIKLLCKSLTMPELEEFFKTQVFTDMLLFHWAKLCRNQEWKTEKRVNEIKSSLQYLEKKVSKSSSIEWKELVSELRKLKKSKVDVKVGLDGPFFVVYQSMEESLRSRDDFSDKPLEVDKLIGRIESLELNILKHGGFFDRFHENRESEDANNKNRDDPLDITK